MGGIRMLRSKIAAFRLSRFSRTRFSPVRLYLRGGAHRADQERGRSAAISQ
jgi:hypothetical protein